jgi:hypothetical protein
LYVWFSAGGRSERERERERRKQPGRSWKKEREIERNEIMGFKG